MKVLVPVDGSRYSSEGIKVASHYAKTKNAQVYIMTVIPSVADIELELSASERDRLLESMKKRGEELLAKAAELIKSLGVDHVNTVLATAPSPAQEIVAFAEREKDRSHRHWEQGTERDTTVSHRERGCERRKPHPLLRVCR